MINIRKLFKGERGTHKAPVKVKRDGKIFYQQRRVGKKESPRKGTGKMNQFPDVIKNKILELRNSGYSGAKIKNYIEGMITFQPEAEGSLRDKLENEEKHYSMLSQEAGKKGLTQERRNYLEQKMKDTRVKLHDLRQYATGEEKLHIDGKVQNRNFVEVGLINDKGKLTVTSQALTDWAKKQGVESTKKRTSVVDAEKVKHDNTKKDLDRADKKISELKVKAKHNLEEIKLVQQSKQESDRIRQELGKDNRDLKTKLKECLSKK